MERKGEGTVNENIAVVSWKKTTFSACNITFSIGQTGVCKDNRKITMKKRGLKHISIPNEKVVGGSFKNRMRKEKNISKQKAPSSCGTSYSPSHKEKHKFTDTEIWKRQTVSASAEMPKLPWQPHPQAPSNAGSNSTAHRDYQVCCNSIRCEHKCQIPKISL